MSVEKESLPDTNEKVGAVAYNSDIESSKVSSSPAVEHDDLPDPDVGKSDEEKAKLVCTYIYSLTYPLFHIQISPPTTPPLPNSSTSQ